MCLERHNCTSSLNLFAYDEYEKDRERKVNTELRVLNKTVPHPLKKYRSPLVASFRTDVQVEFEVSDMYIENDRTLLPSFRVHLE